MKKLCKKGVNPNPIYVILNLAAWFSALLLSILWLWILLAIYGGSKYDSVILSALI